MMALPTGSKRDCLKAVRTLAPGVPTAGGTPGGVRGGFVPGDRHGA